MENTSILPESEENAHVSKPITRSADIVFEEEGHIMLSFSDEDAIPDWQKNASELTNDSAELTPPPTELTDSSAELTPPPTELTDSSAELTQTPTELTNSSEQLTPTPAELTNSSAELTPSPAELTNEEQLLKNDVKKASKGITQKPVGIYIDVFNDVLQTVEEGGMTMLGYCSEILSHHKEIFTIEQVKLDLVAEKEESLKLKEAVFQKDNQISNLESHIADLKKDIEEKDAKIQKGTTEYQQLEEVIKLSGTQKLEVPEDSLTMDEHRKFMGALKSSLFDHFGLREKETDECYQFAIVHACNDLFIDLDNLGWNEKVESSAELQKTFSEHFVKHFQSKLEELALLKANQANTKKQ